MVRSERIVLPVKSDSDVMFCLQSYLGLRIDRFLLYNSYPQDRINTQVIYRFALAQVNNCKQNITLLSLLVGTAVVPSTKRTYYPWLAKMECIVKKTSLAN